MVEKVSVCLHRSLTCRAWAAAHTFPDESCCACALMSTLARTMKACWTTSATHSPPSSQSHFALTALRTLLSAESLRQQEVQVTDCTPTTETGIYNYFFLDHSHVTRLRILTSPKLLMQTWLGRVKVATIAPRIITVVTVGACPIFYVPHPEAFKHLWKKRQNKQRKGEKMKVIPKFQHIVYGLKIKPQAK